MGARETPRGRIGQGAGRPEAFERQSGKAAQFAGRPGRALCRRQDCGKGLLERAFGTQGPPGGEPEEGRIPAPRVLCRPGAPRSNVTLELRDVSKFFGDLAALKAVRLLIEPGESVLLYGPNGAGKTTLLRTLASLCRPSEGRVLFGGEDLRSNSGASKAKVGFVSHATSLYGELTAREHRKFTGALFGLRDIEPKIDAALALFALRERAYEPG